jgi:hypothetical protein
VDVNNFGNYWCDCFGGATEEVVSGRRWCFGGATEEGVYGGGIFGGYRE